MQETTQRHVVVLAVAGALSTALAGPLDVLRTATVLAERRWVPGPRFRTAVVGFVSGEVETFGGLRVRVDAAPVDTRPDAILVAAAGVDPGAVIRRSHEDVHAHPGVVDWLRRCADSGTVVCSGCVGVAWLAAAGLLDGRRATTSFWLHAALARRYSQVDFDRWSTVVEDGPLITAGAAMAYLDLALHLVGHLGTPEQRTRCAELLLLDDQRRSQAVLATLTYLDTQDALVRRAVALMHEQPAGGSLQALCRNLAVTPRSLQRRFREATGASPKDYWLRVRLERARVLLETTDSTVAEIAYQVGYEDVSAFHRAFVNLLGTTPGTYRARFRAHRQHEEG